MTAPPISPRALGQRIRQQRLARGWSVRELADRAGLRQSNLYRIEKNGGGATIHTLCALCVALECSADNLLQFPESGGTETALSSGKSGLARRRTVT